MAEPRRSAAARSAGLRPLRTPALAVGAAVLAAVPLGVGPAGADEGLGYDAATARGSLFHIAQVVGASASHAAGFTGAGVGVALIDTGVTEVPGLDSGNVWHGPDLSFDSTDPARLHRDGYGHGTHLASIIAGRDQAGPPATYGDPSRFSGIAPDATLVSVKVGASDGAVDVSQVIAGIDWVVEHRDDPGLGIRVLTLAYGTDSLQDPSVDPLAYAVENAWRHGIVVVAAAGNDGAAGTGLADPARDPLVLSVGPDDTRGTVDVRDDDVPAWGTRGTPQRHVDVVAPAVDVLGLRVPSGHIDEHHPAARVGSRFAAASGTSQAAAVVSGQVALLLQENPSLTPDQVRALLRSTARPLPRAGRLDRGSGVTDVRAAQVAAVGVAAPRAAVGTGSGSLEAARGSSHVTDGSTPLRGETDVFGTPWNGPAWAAATSAGTAWDGGSWRGTPITGSDWNGRTWRSTDPAAGSWSGRMWGSTGWSGRMWGSTGWSGRMWGSTGWSGRMWGSTGL